jgi:hypothetical protein
LGESNRSRESAIAIRKVGFHSHQRRRPTAPYRRAFGLKIPLLLFRRLLRRIRITIGSDLNYAIPPEIKGDALYAEIARVASTPGLRHILEIGSSSGAGSTEAFVAGIEANVGNPTLHCLEVSRIRFAALKDRYSDRPFVRCYNMSSVSVEAFPRAADVADFHDNVSSNFSRVPMKEALRWLKQDLDYITREGIPGAGIRAVKEANSIETFDAVLIDGSEFTGAAELDETYGARFILLDDICSFKNLHNYERLKDDRSYRLVTEDSSLRNGFATFERRRA